MEFDFIHAKGTIQVKLEAGFELLATWIEQELLTSPKRINEFKAVISALESGLINSWQIATSEHLLELDADELQLNSNSSIPSNYQEPSSGVLDSIFLEHEDYDSEPDSEFDGFASELEQAGCGTADFYNMLIALEDFCISERVFKSS